MTHIEKGNAKIAQTAAMTLEQSLKKNLDQQEDYA
jgi:hypothetical protein